MARSGPARRAALVLALIILTATASPQAVAANSPPDPPVIVSPETGSVSPEDVHMEIGAPFHDPDGDAHQATDWEIRTGDGATVVWAAYGSAVLTHAHFSDGTFQGPLEGQRRLEFKTLYLFRVRFQDSRGAWSAWSERLFATMRLDRMLAQQARGILARPAPSWRDDGQGSMQLPDGARLVLETASGAMLLTLTGMGADLLATPGPLAAQPEDLRLRLVAPAGMGLRLPSSRLAVVTDHAHRLTIYLPTILLPAGGEQVLWVAESGATFYGTPDQSAFTRDVLARSLPLPWQIEPGYRLEAVATTFQLPTSLAFVSNPGTDPAAPRFYVTELHGRIKVVTNDGRVAVFADNLLNFRPTDEFPGDGEQGVIGVCLPPAGHDVYATMVRRDDRGALRVKVSRLRSADGLTATAVEDILVASDDQGTVRPSHQIQQCLFAPDGTLYTFVADGTGPRQADSDATFNGKVLRLNPDGSAPRDNPRYDPARPTAPISYQYSKGHRNAYGLAWRLADSHLYLTENGPNVDRLVRVIPGQHYGWDGSDESMRTNAIYVWPDAHWSPVGLTFVEGAAAAGLPPSKHGRLLVASSSPVYTEGPQRWGKAIQEFTLDAGGQVTGPPTLFARYIGEGRGTIIDLKLQPDGLYFTDLYRDDGDGGPAAPGGTVWRIRYAGQAGFTASVTDGVAPLTVDFTDTSTVVGATTWAWDFGDGQTSAERAPSHTFSQPGRYAVALTVTGADGQPSEHLALITVGDGGGRAPVPPLTPQPIAAMPRPPAIYFPETGVVLGGGFKYFWDQHGGLDQFGYPITQELRERNPADGQVYTVQYFERARFEYHPEHQGTPYETQLGLLGRQVTATRQAEAPFQPIAEPPPDAGDALLFGETGHSLSGVFRARWEATGGLAIYGLPISEPFRESTGYKGRTLVQYFERARLEHMPGAAGTWGEVRSRPLGTIVATRQPAPRHAL